MEHHGEDDGIFHVFSDRESLGPNGFAHVTVTFTPKSPGTFSLESYVFSTAGGNKVALSLQGKALGPTVRLSRQELDFGDVASGKMNSRILYIENESPQGVPFQIMSDPHGVFSFDRTRGVLPEHTVSHVTVTFRPVESSNYWKRVVCLFKVSCFV
ncbi:unnamed protein product [Ostreobium quekettii]|uniref:CFAP65 fourth Ig-like domain-containing protein n=1 Tax=Ostreobium quekettii TaxID=121088 RepID=A0A8S1J8G4_9CHLO|nr:unnamed protein product [Ostreobium quekettii]